MNILPDLLRFHVLLLFFLTGAYCTLNAQDENKFRLYTTADGLSDNSITGIVQDSHGYIWAGTYRGLNRYDGTRFMQFHAGSSRNALPDESVGGMAWLDKTRLAVYTGMGLHVVNTLNGQANDIIVPAYDSQYLYKFNAIRGALGDSEGNTYILGRSGFYHYDAHNRLLFRYDHYNKEQTPMVGFEFGVDILWLSQVEILVTAIDGAHIYNIQTHQFNKVKPQHPFLQELGILPHEAYLMRQVKPGSFLFIRTATDSMLYIDAKWGRKVFSKTCIHNLTDEFGWRSKLFEVNDSLFYLTCQENGFFKIHINPGSGKIVVDPEKYLPGYLCIDFVAGTDGRLWVATRAGLLKETGNASSGRDVSIPRDILKQCPAANIRQLLCYRDKLYAACAGNAGLLVFDKNTLSYLYKISFKKYHSNENVFSLLQARGDTLFVGTNGPLYWLKTSTKAIGVVKLEGWDSIHNWISGQYKDSRGNIWVSINDNTIVYMLPADTREFRRLNYAGSLFEKLVQPSDIKGDRAGNTWISGHGVCRISRETGKPDFYMDSFPYIRFSRKEITIMGFDKNVLWAGIYNNGLAGYDIYKRTFRHFTAQDGLPDNLIRAVYPIGSKLWIATATGIASLDLATNKISRFGGDDGFAPWPVTSGNLWYDTSTHYMFGGFTDHIIRFNPDSLLYAESPPSFFIESIHFSNDTTYYNPGSAITIPYCKNDMTVTMGGVNYNDVSNQRLAYRIANAKDTSWQPVSGEAINFNNLPPGTFRLQVRLYAVNNRWPAREKEIHIIITPPWWRRAWFIILASALLLFLVYKLYRTRIDVVRRTERAKAQVQELKAEEYKNRFELEKISSYFSSSLSDKKDISDVLWDVASNLIGRMGYADCMIYMWNADKTKMEQKAGYGPKGTPEAIARHYFDVAPGQGVVGYVMLTKEAVIIDDTRKDKRYRPDEMFRLSEISVPIIHNGELMGVIDSEHPDAYYYKERDLNLLTTIATLVGNKITQVASETSLRAKREELAIINAELAEAQLTALQTQMNPHFIFNALNSIKRMVLDDEPRNASKYLSKFAQMIRLTLNHSREIFVTLEETIEYLHAYLDMEQLRFGSSFSYIIETTGKPDEDDINIPTLMIQPLAENAIWHGLMPKKGDKKITIRFEQSNDMVTCTIKDNGIGIRQSEKMKRANKQPPVGLDNLRNRIKILNQKYDMTCTLDITDLSEKDSEATGTLAVLRFKVLTR